MKKNMLLFAFAAITFFLTGCSSKNDPNDISCYVDLGLSSGTLWYFPEYREEYPELWHEAMETYGHMMPSMSDFQELLNECTFVWDDNGAIITGPNGKKAKIYGYFYVKSKDHYLEYWTTTLVYGTSGEWQRAWMFYGHEWNVSKGAPDDIYDFKKSLINTGYVCGRIAFVAHP